MFREKQSHYVTRMSLDTQSPEQTPSRQTSYVRRACDCCRKRKVRCDGESPCDPCRKATIRCAYLQPPKKKGPKGLRSAQVLRALRDIDQVAPGPRVASLSPAVPTERYSQWSLSLESSPGAGAVNDLDHATSVIPISNSPAYAQNSRDIHGHPQAHPSDSSVSSATYTVNGSWGLPFSQPQQSHVACVDSQPVSGRVSNARFHPYIQLFFGHLFPIMPIISPEVYLDHRIYDRTNSMSTNTYAFFCALSAATIVQLNASVQLPPSDPLPGRPSAGAENFAEECLRARQHHDCVQRPTVLSVMTSFFLFAYYGNDEGENSERAWLYLQEAITFAEILGLDDERALEKVKPEEAQWGRRLFWLLFVTERYHITKRKKLFNY